MALAPEASGSVGLESAVNDRAARLFRQHSGWIYGYCLRQLRSHDEAEDALQATYLNACRSLKQGFEPQVDSAWLFKVAQNVCLSRLRSSGRRARLEVLHDVAVVEDAVAAPHRPLDELIGLPDALASLTAKQRQAILLREWRGLAYREVAEELQLSQSAVETLIFRARRSLAAALESSESRRPRLLHGLGLPGLLASAKSFFLGGGTAVGVKVAATVAVATTATVMVADPVGWHVGALAEAPQPAVPSVAAKVPRSAVGAVAEPDVGAAESGVERFDHLLDIGAASAPPAQPARVKESRAVAQPTASKPENPGSAGEATSTVAAEGEETSTVAAEDEATGTVEDEDEATGTVEDEATGTVEGEDEATGTVEDEDEATGTVEDEATGTVEDEATGTVEGEDEATGTVAAEDEATSTVAAEGEALGQ